ncbi:hypothetical protein [Streptomyces sp. NPDC005336]|uniref:hypothetical protein n=1 Tax=Streptomyces sp. NPDC005336 TaxID=3157035 RepID=UPI0033A11AC4
MALDTADLIIFEANTTRPHQDHIVAHELAHMICGHRDSTSLDAATAQLIFPNLNPAFVRDMLQRKNYSDTQEREAELMATLILTARDEGPANLPPHPLGALGEALGITQKRHRQW